MLMIVGARGWEHQQWNGSFYENLLPEDWHLKFYSSNFDTVLAPDNYWINCSQEEIEEFCEDVPKEYPLVFEVPETETLPLYQSIQSLVPNWVKFDSDSKVKETSHYTITQAEIVHASNLKENCAVFKLSSSQPLKDTVLREAMQFIKTDFKQYDVVYLYLDDALVEIDILNTACTLLKMLALD